jgi:hypothetical protein
MPYGFKFMLVLPDGTPPDPAVFVTAVPNWSVGEELTVGSGERFRILEIRTDLEPELLDAASTGSSSSSRCSHS